MTYITNAVQPTRPPSALRNETQDWWAISPSERAIVHAFLLDLVAIEDVPLRGRQFLRRHYGRTA